MLVDGGNKGTGWAQVAKRVNTCLDPPTHFSPKVVSNKYHSIMAKKAAAEEQDNNARKAAGKMPKVQRAAKVRPYKRFV